MRAVIQRVHEASVEIDGRFYSGIGAGLLVYLGIGRTDGLAEAGWIAEKIAGLRIFADKAGKMNLSVTDIEGAVLVVSQFTLYGDCRKGRRPGFDSAAEPSKADELYQRTVELIRRGGLMVETGSFGAHMRISSANDGPVTFLLDSPKP